MDGVTLPSLASSLVCVAGSLMFILLPLLVETLRSGAAQGSGAIAMIGSADALGMFFGAAFALVVAPRADRRVLAVASLSIVSLANIASLLLSDSGTLLAASRVCAGIGGGLAMSVGYSNFATSIQPERNFALFGTLQTLLGSVAYKLASLAVIHHGLAALFDICLAMSLIGIAAAFMVERRPQLHSKRAGTLGGSDHFRLGTLTAITYALLGAGSLGVWSNVASIGRSHGLQEATVGSAVSLALLASVAGGVFIIVLGKNHGRALPTWLIGGVYLLGFGLIGFCSRAACFGIGLMAFQFGTNWGSPAFGALSEADRSGRLSIIYLLSLKLGFALGPVLAFGLLRHQTFRSSVGFFLAISLVSAVFLRTTLKLANRSAANRHVLSSR